MKVILVVHLLSPVSKVFTPNYLLKVINMCGVWLWHPDNHLCLVCVCVRERTTVAAMQNVYWY